jgi:hypothetical protein
VAREGTAKALDELSADQKAVLAEVNQARREIAVLQEKVAKLEASRGKAGDRAWSVVPILISVILSGAISTAVAYFITRPGK